MEDFKGTLQSYGEDTVVIKKAVLQGSFSGFEALLKIRVLEPKGFNGNLNAKKLENFLWNMKQFFKATHVPDDERVSITSMYLTSDAKLWWFTKVKDDEEFRRPQITTWETLKKELIERLVPPHQHYLGGQKIIENSWTH